MNKLTADEIRALVKANYTPPAYYKARKSPPINLDDLCDDVVRFYNGDRDQSKIKTTRNTIYFNMRKIPIIWKTRQLACSAEWRVKIKEKTQNVENVNYENDTIFKLFNSWMDVAIKTKPAWSY